MITRALPLLGLLFTFAPGVLADDPPPLFDGKTLDGWKSTEHYKSGTIEVIEGCLRLAEGGPITGVVTTRKDLPQVDYELSYEAKREAGDDFFAAATFPVGEKCVTLVNGGWGGGVTGISRINGADAIENATNSYFKYENGTWYRFRVRVTAKRLRCWVDDKLVVDLYHPDVQLSTRVESRPCEPLGFAAYRSAGLLRKIAIRPLTAAEIAEMSERGPED
jgi:hypothetical protein